MWQWFRRPKTVDAAVRRLAIELPGDYLDFIRGTPSDEAFIGLDHFNLGLYVRKGFGLWRGNRRLIRDCDVGEDEPFKADEASGVILKRLRDHLIATATAGDMRRARLAWQTYHEERDRDKDREATRDAAHSSRRCLACGRPCARYRQTCKYRQAVVGREL